VNYYRVTRLVALWAVAGSVWVGVGPSSGTAHASSVQVVPQPLDPGVRAQSLEYHSSSGETNRLIVSIRGGGDFASVADPGARITAGRNCAALPLSQAYCIALGNQRLPGFFSFFATLGDGNDMLSLSRESHDGAFTQIAVLGEDGNDSLSVARATATQYAFLRGGNGNDVLTGANGPNSIIGDAGDDRMTGGPATDFMDLRGRGRDEVSGLAGEDVADLSKTTTFTGPVFVTLDDVANDGQSGDGANIHSDVEEVLGAAGQKNTIVGSAAANIFSGGSGDDHLDGAAGNDILQGWFGNDTLIGGPGQDRLDGRDGDDVIFANDGEADTVQCGLGNDTAHVDALDSVVDCETLTS
jgi:Ca2+-binding RTX toxin-like protein